ncbi:MAG: DinB family protein [Bacteroidia bacterium]|nr:DinB family protein [Bacteroidia bacterium]
MTQHPKMNSWLRELDQSTKAYLEAFEMLSRKALNWKPKADIWSVGQVVDHVIKLNETYYSKFHELRSGRLKLPLHARVGFIPRFFGNLLLGSVSEDRSRKMKTVAPFFPSESNIPGNIMEKYSHHKEELRQFLRSNEDLISPKTIITSPANNVLVYSTELAVEAIVVHEKRHFTQAQELLAIIPEDILND